MLAWVQCSQIDGGVRADVITADTQREKELERENKALRRANTPRAMLPRGWRARSELGFAGGQCDAGRPPSR